jgi:hypothetical protein
MAMRLNSLSTDGAPLHVSLDRSRSKDKDMQQLKVLFGGLQSLLRPHSCACHRDESSAASAAREAFFQSNDLAWLDSCDKHRNEEIKQAAARGAVLFAHKRAFVA